jgi:hypothetical protein
MISVRLAPAQRRSAPQASVGTDPFTPAMNPFTETEFNGIGGSANLRQDCADMRNLREWKTEYARDRCLPRDRRLCRRFRRSNCAYSSLFTLDAKRTQMRGRRENGMCCSLRRFLLRTMHSLIPRDRRECATEAFGVCIEIPRPKRFTAARDRCMAE